MTIREYVRICKQHGCGQPFIVSAPSLEADRAIGLSEPEYCPKHRLLHARSYSRIACHHYEVEMTPEGEALVRALEARKSAEAQTIADLQGRQFDPWAMPGEGLGPGGLGRFQRPLRAFLENTEFQPQPKVFEIARKRDELLTALDDHQVVILVGTTGSGKSTYVPWLLLTGGEPGQLSKWARRGPICVTQPRIQATRQVPRFIANALNGTSLGPGAQIGFRHANADEYDRRTRLVFMTDGKLINDIVSGAVSNYSIVMIDEAHERSVNIDLILGLMRDQLYLYPHLRLIIASATIDFESFIGYYYPALKPRLASFQDPEYLTRFNYFEQGRAIPFVYSTGRIYGITKHWWGAADLKRDTVVEGEKIAQDELIPDWWTKVNGGQFPTRDQLPQAIGELTKLVCEYLDNLPPDRKAAEDGHILVFLPGTREIDQTVSIVNALNLPQVVSLPLYAQRPLDEQESALNPNPKDHPMVYGKRRVVVSTNVAETSLTVEGVKYVIDTGYIKEAYWNPATEVAELQTVRHSQAGCKQRWGRGGRVSPGHAYLLYTKKQFDETFPKDSTPAIARSSLEQVLLTAKAAGVRSTRGRGASGPLDFAWMPLAKPEDNTRFQQELHRAYQTLERQDMLDGEGDLKQFGLEMRGMPATLDVARIFTEGERHGLGVEVATLLPFLKLDFGLQSLLIWDRAWEAYQKLEVRRHHLDLVYGCQDDLDLYLKLWLLWDARTDAQRQQWEDDGGIHYKNFKEQVEAERRKLLETVMDWRKAENRNVSLGKADALRALIAYCLRYEIYTNGPRPSDGEAQPRSRLMASEALSWESYLEEAGQFQEYDEGFSVDASYVGASSASDVYRRYYPRPGDSDESATIELSPTSVCRGRADAPLVVACQRRPNYVRPARSKVLGMNMIRVDRDWLTTLEGSVVQRALLYAALGRRRDPAEVDHMQQRLFLPWWVRRDTEVEGIVRDWTPDEGARLELHVTRPPDFPLQPAPAELVVTGWLPSAARDVDLPEPQMGATLTTRVAGYSLTSDGKPQVMLSQAGAAQDAFNQFARTGRATPGPLRVVMQAVLEDPLGRNPMFIVREPHSGLEIPMADSDFCGGTAPQAYFGRRFAPSETFEVDVVAVDRLSQTVTLSRARQLLQEYGAIAEPNYQVIKVRVLRVDAQGVYLALPNSSYVGFVRRALWPLGFQPRAGSEVDARLRRIDRNVNVVALQERLAGGYNLPPEIDLGVELDLRVPIAYRAYAGVPHRPGDLVSARITRALDSGGLLVELAEGLVGMVYESELGLADTGRLKSARDYSLGERARVRITEMKESQASVRCSLFRVYTLDGSLSPDQVVALRVLATRPGRGEGNLVLMCSWQDRYQVQVNAAADGFGQPINVDDQVTGRIRRIDETLSLVLADLVERSANG